jgi:histone H4
MKTMGVQTSLELETDLFSSEGLDDTWLTTHTSDYNRKVKRFGLSFDKGGKIKLTGEDAEKYITEPVCDITQRLIPLCPGVLNADAAEDVNDMIAATNHPSHSEILGWLDADDPVPSLTAGLRLYRRNGSSPAPLFGASKGDATSLVATPSGGRSTHSTTQRRGTSNRRRNRRVLRDNIQGITKPALSLLARRAGCLLLSELCYEELRGILKVFLEKVLKASITNAEHARRRFLLEREYKYSPSLLTQDVHAGLMNVYAGRTIAGFGMMG